MLIPELLDLEKTQIIGYAEQELVSFFPNHSKPEAQSGSAEVDGSVAHCEGEIVQQVLKSPR